MAGQKPWQIHCKIDNKSKIWTSPKDKAISDGQDNKYKFLVSFVE